VKVGDLVKWTPADKRDGEGALAIVAQVDSWSTVVQWCDGTDVEDIAPYERVGDTFEVISEGR